MKHKRNTQGLKDHAQQKRDQAVEQTEKAIRQLIKEGRPINFSTVEEVAGVSRTWLYNQPEIRDRIEQLRDQQPGKKKVARSQKASDASNAAMILTLKEKLQKSQAENRGLHQQMEEIVGRSIYADEQAEHYKREAEKLRAENATLKQQLAQYKQPTRLGVVDPSNSQPATSIPPTSPQQDLQQKIQQELTRLGVKLNSTLSRSIRSKDEQIVLTALKALEEAIETGTVKNPASWLREAIEKQWEPNGNNTQPSETNNLKLFNEWFSLAKSKGLVVAVFSQLRVLF
jgi:hypothetical protein